MTAMNASRLGACAAVPSTSRDDGRSTGLVIAGGAMARRVA
ncbi:hypothetical protein [Burkholderia plantarii]|nr:hypothetical protein [Burkholderia plantarii]